MLPYTLISSEDQGDGSRYMFGDTMGKILFTEEDIRKRAEELGAEITLDYKGTDLIVVGTLNGAVMWMSDLVKNIGLDIRLDFISAHSYGSGTFTSGSVNITKDIELDVREKDVLIVEDIVDSGNTLSYLKEVYFAERGAKTVRVCTMLNKPSRRLTGVVPEYVGFTVDDIFIVGYGLDYDQKYRNLPYISYLE